MSLRVFKNINFHISFLGSSFEFFEEHHTIRWQTMNNTEEVQIYKVVVNLEEQYSIWPNERENPLGWQNAGYTGLKAECLAYIEKVWTDMRPLSLRRNMGNR
jgi:MbtH protein